MRIKFYLDDKRIEKEKEIDKSFLMDLAKKGLIKMNTSQEDINYFLDRLNTLKGESFVKDFENITMVYI